MRRFGSLVLGVSVVLSSVLLVPDGVDAQRDPLIRSAMESYDNFDTETALGLLKVAVNPAVGPTDSVWAAGIQLLTQMLIEEGEDSLANVWMRWAVRTSPDMAVDTVTYLPEVVNAYRVARFMVGSGSAGDVVTETSWEWDAGIGEDRGDLRVEGTGVAVPMEVIVEGLGQVGTGAPVRLSPGTYEVRVSAEGYVGAEVTREVLPGVVTVLDFGLRSLVASLPDSEISADAEALVRRQLGLVSVTRFGMPESCGAGVFVGSDGLFLTTYRSIRGAEGVEVRLSNGRQVSDGISIAAYDAARDVAVLSVPESVGDSLELSPGVGDDQNVWALGYPDCRSAAISRLRIAGWQNRPVGLLRLSDSLGFGGQGGPLISQSGAVVGMSLGGVLAVPADHAMASLDEARANLRAQRLLSFVEVALRENHRYGSVSISSDVSGSVVRIRPLESWQWSEAGRDGALPLTFSGPMGRYRVQMLLGSTVRRSEEFTINPAVTEQLALMSDVVAQVPGEEPAAVQSGGGGKFPWPIALLGLAGAGAAVGLLAGGGGPPDPDNPSCPSGQRWDGTRCVVIPTTGGIIINIPVTP